jgi:hypothetical protein
MDEQFYKEFVIRHLAGGIDRAEVIYQLCDLAQMSWPEAEAFVSQVELDESLRIAKRQNPVLFIISLVIFLGGMILTIWALTEILDPLWSLIRARSLLIPLIKQTFILVVNFPQLIFGMGMAIAGGAGILNSIDIFSR